jgi:rubrerythrin
MKNSIYLLLMAIFLFTGCASRRQKAIEHLKTGVKTETAAHVLFKAYAQQAYRDSCVTIARLFEAIAKSEEIHASGHAKVLDETFKMKPDPFIPEIKVGSTAENLQSAIRSLSVEVDSIYPLLVEDAKALKWGQTAVESLTYSSQADQKHRDLLNKALEAVQANAEYTQPLEYLVCPVCGNTVDKQSMADKCAICGASNVLFVEVNE